MGWGGGKVRDGCCYCTRPAWVYGIDVSRIALIPRRCGVVAALDHSTKMVLRTVARKLGRYRGARTELQQPRSSADGPGQRWSGFLERLHPAT